MWLVGGRLYDVASGAFRSGDLRVENGRIQEIGKAPQNVGDRIGLEGSNLLPGFFDCHVHICVDTYSPDPNNPWASALPGAIALFAAEAARKRADGASVRATLVRSGWALDWPRYSKGEYADEQEAAKEERFGLWRGEFMPPWKWRADRRK